MKTPFVSVIIPAYNEEKYIGSCLKSVINQDYPKSDYEIIVVDNNCVDKTALIAQSLMVKVVKENEQGLVYARLKGIKEAKGEIVVFIDADCEASASWLTKMILAFQKDEKVVGVSQLLDYRPKNLWTFISQPPTDLAHLVLKIMPGGHFAFRKDAYIKSGGYSAKTNFNEDTYISKKLRKVGKLVIQNRGLVITSSRRYSTLRSFISYAVKVIISTFTITFFDRSFFKLKPVLEKK